MLMRNTYPAALALAFCLGLPSFALAQDAVPVRVVTPTQEAVVEKRALSGSLTSLSAASLSPRESGVVERIAADAGQQVKAGDTLLVLDATLSRLQAARVKASLAESRVRLAEAERVRDESAKLADQRNIARTQARAAEAEARIQAAAMASARAEADLAEERVRRHTLKAPFDGVIVERHVDAGEWVDAATPVFELVDSSNLRFDLQVPQELHGAIADGDAVQLQIDAFPGLSFAGSVAAVVPVKDPAARTFLVRIKVDDPDSRLQPGMSGRAELALARRAQAWTLPRDALVRYPDGTHGIWVIETGSNGPVARARQVELGLELGDRREIRAGIRGGEQVVERGNERLRDGAPVRVLNDAR
ncbi:MAG: efflux RND transporter periplasmic adaptor subunit [Lysobacterales bacterium]